MASTVDELLYISGDVWHPSCWTLETTRDTDVGLYGHGTAESKGLDAAVGAFTPTATPPPRSIRSSRRRENLS